MKNIFKINFAIVATLLCSFAFAERDLSTSLQLIEKYQMGSNMESIAYQLASKMVTGQIIIKKYGAVKGRFIIMDALHEEAPKHQKKWNQNLASVYANHLADFEILSLVKDGKFSPYASKMSSIQPSVGAEMEKASMPIVTEMVTQALLHAFENLPKE